MTIQCGIIVLTKMEECNGTVVPIAKDGGDASLVQIIGGLTDKLSSTSLNEPSDCFGRPGSQLEEKLEFKSKDGKSVWAYPVLVDFRRLLQLGQVSETSGLIPGVSNQDLLHAVVGLYDTSLSDMDADTIYTTICEKWARTIVLVRDLADTIKDMEERRKKKLQEKKEEKKSKKATQEKGEEEEEDDDDADEDDGEDVPPEEDFLEEDEGVPSKFADVFSDTDNDEEEDEDDEEDEETEEPDFTKGINAFIRTAKERRADREEGENVEIRPEHVGIENMLLGCASFEKKYVCDSKERVIHLTFIGVRRRTRKFQMGRYLLSKSMDPTVVGPYEAVVVHADHSAVEFFAKFGFTNDVLLNSKWSELAEQFTQCTLMCYIPGFSLTGTELVEVSSSLKGDPELGEIEEEFKKWQEKSLQAYQSQLLCMRKLQQEILQMKALTRRQSEQINKLLEDNETLRLSSLSAERDLLTHRLDTARSTFRIVASSGDLDNSDEDDIATDSLIRDLERKAAIVGSGANTASLFTKCDNEHYMVGDDRTKTTYDHAEDVSFFSETATHFKQIMAADRSVRMQYEVSSIIKAILPSSVEERLKSCLREMSEPSMVARLYYCGTLEKPHRCQEILSGGFTSDDFSHGEYGYGLYFSKYPSKAAQFSALGKLLLVEVGLGALETVIKENRTRKSPSSGFDSILTPGRLSRSDGDSRDGPLCQEYVVFKPAQVRPVCLLTYKATSK